MRRLTQVRRTLRAVVALAALAGYPLWTVSGGSAQDGKVLVTRVIDGDTVIVGRGWREQRVRLLGVDTPETVRPNTPVQYYGPEASAHTKRRLGGQWVRLSTEPNNLYDSYHRLLAYIILSDGTLYNAELIQQGYARAYTRFPMRYRQEFKRYEREAKNAGRGLWQRAEY